MLRSEGTYKAATLVDKTLCWNFGECGWCEEEENEEKESVRRRL